ncbi:MAG: CCA tRNA nucleotidyltransferase [Azospirillum sp.]|nr:CCA tRNA nucleotidyltransferase [Azospirillum sp.]
MFTSFLSEQPWMAAPATRAVVAALTKDGSEARFVGGSVRDAIVGRPIKDIDIATPLPPHRIVACLTAAGLRAIPTGIAHGTVTALVDGQGFEITTLRRDVETDGRHARVAYTDDWREDAARRDFTMNALSLSPDGSLYDPFDGIADLKAGRVRFVGDPIQRIREDVLRLLRFFRFFAHYGRGEPDAPALAACCELAPSLPMLSGERVRVELFRLLDSGAAAAVWHLMVERGILARLLPQATDTEHLAGLLRIDEVFGLRGEDRRLVRLAALLDTNRAGAIDVAARLRLAKAERDRLVALIAPPLGVAADDDRFHRRRALLLLRDSARYRDLVMLAAAATGRRVLDADLAPAFETAAAWDAARFPLTGQDVLDRGVPAGPLIGEWLAELEEWWTDSDFQPDREACLRELGRRVAGLADDHRSGGKLTKP